MTLYEQITALYPELASDDFSPFGGTIALQNDSDGRGDYIKAWNHPTLPEPTADQLAALEVTPMSTLKTTNLQHASAASPAIVLASDGTATAQLSNLNGGPLSGARNRIINGDMRIDQRNAGASVNLSTVVYPVDRWAAFEDTDGSMTAQQSSVVPSGFTNSVLVTTTSADASLSAAQYARIWQNIEGLNLSDLAWGTASAKSITVGFWVRSSLTGTFGGSVANSAFNRSYPFTYSISAADTWEYKTATIPGDTSGTWLTTNGTGIQLNFGLGVGSTYSGTAGTWAGTGYVSATGATSVVGTNGATFYITGVQLEAGSVATPFERRSYGQELALCQRYFQKSFPQTTAPAQNAGTSGAVRCQGQAASAPAYAYFTLPVTMRVAPTTVTLFNPSAANANWRNTTAGSDINSNVGMAADNALYINANTQVLAQYQEAAIHYTASAEI